MCCGHIAALAAMLVLSPGQNKIGSSFGRQGAVLGAPWTWDIAGPGDKPKQRLVASRSQNMKFG